MTTDDDRARVVQCDNWNVTDGRHQLRPIRCQRNRGHDGLHVCGDTTWSDHYGAVLPPQPDTDDRTGQR